MDSKTIRAKLKLAFAALREQGYAAKENFLCCQSCGGAAIDLKGKKGGVFWHGQDDEGLKEHGSLYISFLTKEGGGSEKVGAALAVALRSEGLQVEWNGTAAERVKVKG